MALVVVMTYIILIVIVLLSSSEAKGYQTRQQLTSPTSNEEIKSSTSRLSGLHLADQQLNELGGTHLNLAGRILKGSGLAKHRVRRLVGGKTKCLFEPKKFCSKFTHGSITKKFCLVVRVKRCTALD